MEQGIYIYMYCNVKWLHYCVVVTSVLLIIIVSAAGMCCFEKSLGCLDGGVDEDLAHRLVETNIKIFKVYISSISFEPFLVIWETTIVIVKENLHTWFIYCNIIHY